MPYAPSFRSVSALPLRRKVTAKAGKQSTLGNNQENIVCPKKRTDLRLGLLFCGEEDTSIIAKKKKKEAYTT